MAGVDRPAAEGIAPGWFPGAITSPGHVQPVPRRIRAVVDGQTVLDTRRALYLWEHPYYPGYAIPAADVRADLLADDGKVIDSPEGPRSLRSLVVGDRRADGAAQFLPAHDDARLAQTYRFSWSAMDAWYEEDEQVFVHPRSPYVRLDALRSSGHLRVSADGALLAEAHAWVTVLETGLPPRFYLDPMSVNHDALIPSETRTACPYKGRTTGYWHVDTASGRLEDVAWAYDFPARQVLPIAGLVAFLNEQVDIFLDGVRL